MNFFWILKKYLFPFGRSRTSSLFAVISLILAVACLVTSLAVINGYEKTLKKTITQSFGHMMIFSSSKKDHQEMLKDMKPYLHSVESHSPFVFNEALVVSPEKVSSVGLEGVKVSFFKEVVDFKKLLTKGSFEGFEEKGIILGKETVRSFGFDLGDSVQIVQGGGKDQARVDSFKLIGVLDLGRFDYNSRFALVHQDHLQNVEGVSGVRIRFKDLNVAEGISQKINLKETLYTSQTWKSLNHNLFEAIRWEKRIIFLVLLILVMGAGFNVSSYLFVKGFQTYKDVSILKTLGVTRRFIFSFFVFQGLWLCLLGIVGGVILGAFFSFGFLWIQNFWDLLPAQIYKLGFVDIDFRLGDILLVSFSCLGVCFLASFFSALKLLTFPLLKGLHYE